MHTTEVGATEWLANLSIGYIVLAAFVLTCIRLVLAPSRAPAARSIAELIESLVIAGVLVFLVIRPFFVQAFYIPSMSMEPTLLGHSAGEPAGQGLTYDNSAHDQLFVNKLIYRLRSPQHGDIIVFRAPKDADISGEGKENVLIKRLIGLPGDTIEVKKDADGVTRVFRDGKALVEPYIKEPMRDPQDMASPTGHPTFAVDQKLTLGPHQLFVMGDNRNNSNDSRYWGPLDDRRVIGKAWFIFWPISRIGFIR